MELLKHYLPTHHFGEMHALDMDASPCSVMDAVERYNPEADPVFHSMIALRELPMRMGSRIGRATGPGQPPFGLHNFLMLERLGNDELAYGLLGRFWQSDFGLETVPDAKAFLDYANPGVAKLVLGFSASIRQDGRTRLTTETRVYCPDRATRLKFAPYWYLIRPFSGLIRGRILGAIKTASEKAENAASARA